MLLPLLLLLLLRLLLAGGVLSPPLNDHSRNTTVEGDEGLVPSRSEPPDGSAVSGSPPAASAATPTSLAASGEVDLPRHFEVVIVVQCMIPTTWN